MNSPLQEKIGRAMAKLFLVVVSFSVALLILLMLFQQPIRRFHHPAYPFVHRYNPDASWTRDSYGGLAAMTGNPEHRVVRRVTHTTDSWGFMNDIDGEVFSPIDVLVLGDSFTASSPIDQSKLWPNRLAEISELTVYNLGHPAEGPWHQLMNFQIERHRLSLTDRSFVVWAMFSGNDLDDYYGEAFTPPPPANYNWRGKSRRVIEHKWRFSTLGRLIELRNKQKYSRGKVAERKRPDAKTVLFLKAYAERANRTIEDIHAHPNYDRLRATIERMHNLSRIEGIHLGIVCFPSKPEIYRWLYENSSPWSTKSEQSAFSISVRDICESLEIPYLNLTLPFSRRAQYLYEEKQKFLYWEDDTHLNELGHQLAAELIAKSILLTYLQSPLPLSYPESSKQARFLRKYIQNRPDLPKKVIQYQLD